MYDRNITMEANTSISGAKRNHSLLKSPSSSAPWVLFFRVIQIFVESYRRSNHKKKGS